MTPRAANIHDLAASIGLAIVAVAAFWPALGNGFINFDDPQYLTGNSIVQNGLTSEGVKWAFSTFTLANWHPLTWLSLMLDVELFELQAGRHHAMGIVLHAINAMLVLWLLRSLGFATWSSVLAAGVWAIHPLRVESVAWAAERKDVLSLLFGLLALLMYLRFSRRGGWWRYGVVVVMFGLSLMAKPMLVTLPLVMLLLDVWPLGRLWSTKGIQSSGAETASMGSLVRRSTSIALIEKLPLLAMSAASCIVTILAQQRGGAMSALEPVPWITKLQGAMVGYVAYLDKTVRPIDLTIFYPHPRAWPALMVWLSAIGLAVVSALVCVALVRGKAWAWGALWTGWLWFLGTLVPVIGFVQVGKQWIADRYTYAPAVGLAMMFAGGLQLLAGSRDVLRYALILGAALALTLVPLTMNQTRLWRDSVTVFGHAVAVNDENATAHHNLGEALLRQRRLDDALEHFRKAVDLDPNYATARNSLGNLLLMKGDVIGALTNLREAVRLNPRYAEAHAALGNCFAAQDRLSEAQAELRKALELSPSMPRARLVLANVLARQGLMEQAVDVVREELSLQPNDAEARRMLEALQQAIKR